MSKDKSVLIPAVGYLRKSTKGERIDRHGQRRERQEKSLAQQKTEIAKLAKGRFEIVQWFEDEGVSGWKRGAKRPDFQRMLDAAAKLRAQAVVCDNLDRFSRAAFDEVQEDVNALRKAGVRWIVTCSHGEYDLGQRFDIGCILKFVVAVWSSCEYSRQLGRRIALARRNAAADGRRTGGNAAYGMENDGKGGLKPGDPATVKVVRWIFDQFANEHRSLHWIVGDLNQRQKVAGPTGGTWYVRTVQQLLQRRCYRGDFVFNRKHGGQFFGIDDKGEVVERSELNGTAGKLFEKRGVYKPIIDAELFDRAQRRLDTLAKHRSRRKRAGYPLTGILVCDHCGKPMHGVRQKRHKEYGPTIYRCGTAHDHGPGACRPYQVREDRVLPFVLRTLGEEMENLESLLTAPPDKLREPNKERLEGREQTQRERDQLTKKIERTLLARIESDDKRTRQEYDRLITQWRDELDRLDSELAHEPATEEFSHADLDALTAWWSEFERTAVSVPTKGGGLSLLESFHQDPSESEPAVLADPRKVNEALHQVGCEVRLRWENVDTGRVHHKSKLPIHRYSLVRGRFRLGQKQGRLPRYVLESPAAPATRSRVWSPSCAGSPSKPCRPKSCAPSSSK